MYNRNQKIKFINEYTINLTTAKICESLFNKLEPFENMWDADICTKCEDDIRDAVNSITTIKEQSIDARLTILKSYAEWCLKNKIDGACDGLLNIKPSNIEVIKKRMVSNPIHLQEFLNSVFKPETNQSVDDLYRCYCWLAYSGMSESDIFKVNCNDVDFDDMVVHCENGDVILYRESLRAFKNCVTLNQFAYYHPNYKNIIFRERVSGESLLRGIKSDIDPHVFKVEFARRITKSKPAIRLSYKRIYLSGIFYRMYSMEQAGYTPDFINEAEKLTANIEYKSKRLNNSDVKRYKQKEMSKALLLDYNNWKFAFR